MTNATNELKVVTKGRLNLFGPEDKFDFDDDEAQEFEDEEMKQEISMEPSSPRPFTRLRKIPSMIENEDAIILIETDETNFEYYNPPSEHPVEVVDDIPS